MKKSWTETLIALLIVGLASVVVIVGVFIYLNKSTPAIHKSARDVTSVMRAAPSPKWAGAADKARQVVLANVVEQNLPGISAAVGVGGDIVWAEGFGLADLTTRSPVAPETRFRIGHVSKALTSTAVGLLLEKGRVHLDHDIQEYVPSFPKKPWPVTLRQLMGHTSGIRHYADTTWGDKPTARCERASDGVPAFANDALLFQPETKYQYSTYGWVLVSAAVESVAGEPFFQFMRTQVFAPLGMTETIPDFPTDVVTDRATSYFVNNFGREVTTGVDYSCFAGAGAFLSTPSDVVRFGMAVNGGKLLQPATVKMLQTRQQLVSGAETDYGLGWMLETIDLAGKPTLMASHASRTMEGASTSFLTFPERGLVVVVSSNISFVNMRSIALAIAQAFVTGA